MFRVNALIGQVKRVLNPEDSPYRYHSPNQSTPPATSSRVQFPHLSTATTPFVSASPFPKTNQQDTAIREAILFSLNHESEEPILSQQASVVRCLSFEGEDQEEDQNSNTAAFSPFTLSGVALGGSPMAAMSTALPLAHFNLVGWQNYQCFLSASADVSPEPRRVSDTPAADPNADPIDNDVASVAESEEGAQGDGFLDRFDFEDEGSVEGSVIDGEEDEVEPELADDASEYDEREFQDCLDGDSDSRHNTDHRDQEPATNGAAASENNKETKPMFTVKRLWGLMVLGGVIVTAFRNFTPSSFDAPVISVGNNSLIANDSFSNNSLVSVGSSVLGTSLGSTSLDYGSYFSMEPSLLANGYSSSQPVSWMAPSTVSQSFDATWQAMYLQDGPQDPKARALVAQDTVVDHDLTDPEVEPLPEVEEIIELGNELSQPRAASVGAVESSVAEPKMVDERQVNVDPSFEATWLAMHLQDRPQDPNASALVAQDTVVDHSVPDPEVEALLEEEIIDLDNASASFVAAEMPNPSHQSVHGVWLQDIDEEGLDYGDSLAFTEQAENHDALAGFSPWSDRAGYSALRWATGLNGITMLLAFLATISYLQSTISNTTKKSPSVPEIEPITAVELWDKVTDTYKGNRAKSIKDVFDSTCEEYAKTDQFGAYLSKDGKVEMAKLCQEITDARVESCRFETGLAENSHERLQALVDLVANDQLLEQAAGHKSLDTILRDKLLADAKIKDLIDETGFKKALGDELRLDTSVDEAKENFQLTMACQKGQITASRSVKGGDNVHLGGKVDLDAFAGADEKAKALAAAEQMAKLAAVAYYQTVRAEYLHIDDEDEFKRLVGAKELTVTPNGTSEASQKYAECLKRELSKLGFAMKAEKVKDLSATVGVANRGAAASSRPPSTASSSAMSTASASATSKPKGNPLSSFTSRHLATL